MKKLRKNKKKFKELKNRAIAMEETLNSLNDTLIAISQAASVQTRYNKTIIKHFKLLFLSSRFRRTIIIVIIL